MTELLAGLRERRAGCAVGGRRLGTEVAKRRHGAQACGGPAQGSSEGVACGGMKTVKRYSLSVKRSGGLTWNVSRLTINVALAAVLAASAGTCGKKTAPVPPEDVPPSKQDRSK